MSGATAREQRSSESMTIDPLVIRVLTQLGAAVQRHRIYPPLSPLCQEAVETCADTLRTLAIQEAKRAKTAAESAGPRSDDTDTGATDAAGIEGEDDVELEADALEAALEGPVLSVMVGAGRLFIDGAPVPSASALDDLAERLFRAEIEEMTLFGDVTVRDLARFARRLAGWERSRDQYGTLSEALREQDVTGVRVRCAERLEVLDFDVVPIGQLDALRAERETREREQRTQDAAQEAGWDRDPVGGSQSNRSRAEAADRERTENAQLSLQRAWVRVDTDCPLDPIDMLDLAYLVDRQSDLSTMLLGLAEGDPHSIGAPIALRETVSELVHLYSDLSGEASTDRFNQLAASLMELDPSTRRTLTRDVLMPDLLQSGKAAQVLRRLPDGEIVEAVRALTDVDIGGDGLAGLALKRLGLPEERLQGMKRAFAAEMRAEPSGPHVVAHVRAPADASSPIRLESDPTVFRNMRELAAMDLAVTQDVAERLRGVRQEVNDVDGDAVRLDCVLDLIPMVRNPDRAAEILDSVVGQLRPLLWEDPATAASMLDRLLGVAHERESIDPEIAGAIVQVLGSLIDVKYIQFQADRVGSEGSVDPAVLRLLEVLGPTASSSFLQALEEADDRVVRRSIIGMMSGCADLFAPHLETFLDDTRWTVVRNAVRVMGFAGPGYEAQLAPLFLHSEKRVVREVFLALSRIGTPRAAEEILRQLEVTDPRRRELAEDAIRRFPKSEGEALTERLISRSSFYMDRPQVAMALIARFMNPPSKEGRLLLEPLAKLRFKFWRPTHSRLGRVAASALRGGAA